MKTGKISGNVLKRSILRQLKTEGKEVLNGAGIGEDCAIFSFSSDLTVSCMQEAALLINGESRDGPLCLAPRFSMAQLIQKCANNLAAAGAEPVAVMITLLLPESIEEPELKTLMAQAAEKCGQLSMAIAGGQSRVTAEVLTPMAVVAGFGRKPGSDRECSGGKARPGQEVVLSKWIGLEGTAFLAERYREKLLLRYPASMVEEAAEFGGYLSILPEAAAAVQYGVCAMHDASEGGIFAALWELAEKAGVGLTIDLKKLPIRQETVEVCEYCGINPYELLSGGCLVMTAEDGTGLAAALNSQQIPAVVVGRVTDRRERIFVNEEEIRYMDRPGTDELYRVFEKKANTLP